MSDNSTFRLQNSTTFYINLEIDERQFMTLFGFDQSIYREVPLWEIFMEQELRFGLDLGRFGNF